MRKKAKKMIRKRWLRKPTTAKVYNTSVRPSFPRPFKFPGRFTLDYESDLVHAGITAATFAGFTVSPNDLLDVDKSVASFFGNKQPYFL